MNRDEVSTTPTRNPVRPNSTNQIIRIQSGENSRLVPGQQIQFVSKNGQVHSGTPQNLRQVQKRILPQSPAGQPVTPQTGQTVTVTSGTPIRTAQRPTVQNARVHPVQSGQSGSNQSVVSHQTPQRVVTTVQAGPPINSPGNRPVRLVVNENQNRKQISGVPFAKIKLSQPANQTGASPTLQTRYNSPPGQVRQVQNQNSRLVASGSPRPTSQSSARVSGNW